MSTQLGPIHFWLYHKIQMQQEIVEEILKLGECLEPGLREELDARYGSSETKQLEQVIDVGNIHAWLQENVSRSEYKLAYSITTLAKKNQDFLKSAEAVFKRKGKEKSVYSENVSDNAMVAYKIICDSLLDGMPCDHVNELVEENEEQVIWKRSTCVHKSYWDAVGGDVSMYYSLRDAFIRGVLMGTSLIYEQEGKEVHMIVKNL